MLQKIGFQPGINKQLSETGAEGQWTDCDNQLHLLQVHLVQPMDHQQ